MGPSHRKSHGQVRAMIPGATPAVPCVRGLRRWSTSPQEVLDGGPMLD